jgi:hypothetical protein
MVPVLPFGLQSTGGGAQRSSPRRFYPWPNPKALWGGHTTSGAPCCDQWPVGLPLPCHPCAAQGIECAARRMAPAPDEDVAKIAEARARRKARSTQAAGHAAEDSAERR